MVRRLNNMRCSAAIAHEAANVKRAASGAPPESRMSRTGALGSRMKGLIGGGRTEESEESAAKEARKSRQWGATQFSQPFTQPFNVMGNVAGQLGGAALDLFGGLGRLTVGASRKTGTQGAGTEGAGSETSPSPKRDGLRACGATVSAGEPADGLPGEGAVTSAVTSWDPQPCAATPSAVSFARDNPLAA